MKKENKSVFTAAGNPEEIIPNRKYKDTLFRMLFNDKEQLLSLYNALNGTAYTDTSQLEIVTLENAVYMNIKNDLAFIFMNYLTLYAHQSTVNPNLPLRGLFYIASEYEKIVQTEKHSLYGSRLLMIPAPRFIVFYNGEEQQPEYRVQKLSDAYQICEDNPCLELKVTILNINLEQNKKLLKQCQTLYEYILYVDKVQRYSKKMDIRSAVNRAVNECINEGILHDFLVKNKSEAIRMSIFEYDEERELRLIRQDERMSGFEEGLNQGLNQGLERGEKQHSVSVAQLMLTEQEPIEKIVKYSGLGIEKILQLKETTLISK